MTTAQRDGVLTVANGRLRFSPEVYPVEHLRNEGWRKDADGSWTAPATHPNLARLQVLFPAVKLGVHVQEWLLDLQEPSRVRPFASDSLTIEEVNRTPDPWDRLFSYQQRAAEWLARCRSAIVCLSPGLGKSAVALIAAQLAGTLSTTIVCPLTLLGTWQEQIAQWWPQAKVHVLREQPDYRDTTLSPHAPDIFLLTYDRLRRSGLPLRTHLLIFDESVLLKNRKAARTKAAALARRQVQTCWMLSGAPTTRFYDDLWAQLHILEPKTYSSYWRWSPKYVLISETIWGRQIVANVPGIEPTLKRDLAPIFYSYSYADLAREEPQRAIPEWVFETRQVLLPEKWWRLYKQMQDKFVADLPDGNRVLAPNTLARLVRLLQLASHPALLAQAVGGDPDGPDFSGYDWSTKDGKVSAIPELLDELPGPTILWTTFIATAKHIAATLKAPCLIGETPAEERTKIVAEFQAGKHPVLIAHPGVGRFGLTLTRARSMIFVERDFSADHHYQALFRARRIGTTEPPRVVYLEATGPNGEATTDRAVARVLSYRKDKSEQLTTSLLKEVLG